jgi:hypothetical protein
LLWFGENHHSASYVRALQLVYFRKVKLERHPETKRLSKDIAISEIFQADVEHALSIDHVRSN